jgi:predicted Ser/Thr protein kinase
MIPKKMGNQVHPEPWLASGGAACVFKYQTNNPQKQWAVRCFTNCSDDIEQQYSMVSQALQNCACRQYFVDFKFLKEGILVQGKLYPVVRMEWVEGEDFKVYIQKHLNTPKKLMELAVALKSVSRDLQAEGIAHGDLQHGNILVVEVSGIPTIKLIDYDSLHSTRLEPSAPLRIKGLPDYQHPAIDHCTHKCLEVDHFPSLIMYLSLLALAEDKSLWSTFKLKDTERLLFSKADFEEPDTSQTFCKLLSMSAPIAALAKAVQVLCKVKDIRGIPSLEEVIQGKTNATTKWVPTVPNQPPAIGQTNASLPISQPTNPTPQKWKPKVPEGSFWDRFQEPPKPSPNNLAPSTNSSPPGNTGSSPGNTPPGQNAPLPASASGAPANPTKQPSTSGIFKAPATNQPASPSQNSSLPVPSPRPLPTPTQPLKIKTPWQERVKGFIRRIAEWFER